ncbi:MAG TPA: HlyD family efflux transporter periplasmic adaptor subunit [Burkholderiaceae bacterium]|nr:HlyD family efflux transporter periplasmic adaptor subunit [Burkholderiaceae bacterium]HQR75101.1 HlyD family efflux transporter periplasmic adaptor subunit [Burkholderiaceae bacterium]
MAAPSKQLFRQEAIDAQREKLLGEVSLARPVPLWIFTALAGAFAVTLVAFSIWGEYARRERVDGFLALDTGAARILAPEAGTVADLLAKEGDEVEAGQPLIRLSFERGTASGVTSGELVQREISERQLVLEREQQQVKLLGQQQADALRRKIADLERELAQFDVEIKAQQSRLASSRNEFQRAEELYKEKFYSESKMIEFRNNVLDQQVKVETLKRQRAGVERELSAARAEEPSIALKTQTALEQIRRQASELQQGSVQEEAKRENVIRAPVAGVLTNIAAARGETVAESAPLAVVVPKGSGLHAQLLVPTRAIGFVAPGQEVVLRYDAFPFQRFGQYRGTVERVSRTVWSPGEKVGQLVVKEPVYRVDVRLDAQYVAVGDQKLPLRSGMMVNADILQEKRKVWEWVFEPVLSLKQRLQ